MHEKTIKKFERRGVVKTVKRRLNPGRRKGLQITLAGRQGWIGGS